MTKTISKSSVLGLVVLLIISGCIKKPGTQIIITNQFNNSIFISCEGGFGKGTAGVTVYNRDTKNVTTDIYSVQNKLPLGDVCQSLTHIGNLIYCVVNNSNKIEIVDANTFKHTTTISSLNQPRYLTAVSNTKGYISEWGTSDIAVLDLKTNIITKHIHVGNGPEAISINGNYAYVANCGGNTKDSTVSVIDTRTDSVLNTIKTNINPCAFSTDINGYLWILCSGYSNYVAPYDFMNGSLICIDPKNNNKLIKNIALPFNSYLPRMAINSALNILYFNSYSSVYSQKTNSTIFDNQIIVNRSFYSIGLDPTHDIIYGSNASFIGNGSIYRYTTAGSLIDTFKCGIGAGNFLFQ